MITLKTVENKGLPVHLLVSEELNKYVIIERISRE